MKNFLIVVLIIVLGAGVYLMFKKTPVVAPTNTYNTTVQKNAIPSEPASNSAAPAATDTAAGAAVSGSVVVAKPEQVTVTIAHSAFTPAMVTVPVGSTVTWKQEDAVSHSVVSDSSAFSSGTLSTGKTYRFTFTKPGTYGYHCGIHPMMKGTIVVQ